MNNNPRKPVWTLKEISEWNHQGSLVSIPAIQRGLVWKPQQVELLWDSILRQFPIGSFTLSESREEGDCPYNLLDGQQRWNAIALGYGSVLEARSILWFDLRKDTKIWGPDKTTRKYIIRATTKAHPWGYEANDECSRFNTEQKRDALKHLGMTGKSLSKDEISLSDTYPIKSELPIPLFWLLEAGEKSKGNRAVFIDSIRKKIKDNREARLEEAKKKNTFRLKDEDIPDDLLADYQTVFESVVHYTVPTIYLQQSIIDNEEGTRKIDEEMKSDIEILFARIGTGGTQITQNELIYSAIKAYWPRSIKEENETLAEKYMPPFTLISLAFRLALSPSENGKLAGALSVKKVRQIAAEKESKAYLSILGLYNTDDKKKKSQLEVILQFVDKWLTRDSNDGMIIPRVIRTGIARTSPDVYLLLMSIAKMVVDRKINPTDKDVLLFRATAFYLHWMVDKSARGQVASSLYKDLQDNAFENWNSVIKRNLMRLYTQRKAIPLIPKETFSKLFGERISDDPKWRTDGEYRSNEPWWPLWCKVKSEREMLLYAQREYLCDKFPNYDPAEMDMWEEYNRPWDYDHIIPQDWIYQYRAWRKEYSDYCNEWKDNNGNMAAIPFEVNRAKSNEADWQEYIKYSKQLLVDEENIGRFKELFHSDLTNNRVESQLFAQYTFNRLCKIYSEIYDLLSPVDINNDDILDLADKDLEQRRNRLRSIAKGGVVYYECNNKEYPQEHNDDWAWQWMSTGVITPNGRYYAAITMEINQECSLSNKIEIGLRRMPGSYELTGIVTRELLEKCNSLFRDNGLELHFNMDNGSWWHIYSTIPISTTDEDIVRYIETLEEFAEKELD